MDALWSLFPPGNSNVTMHSCSVWLNGFTAGQLNAVPSRTQPCKARVTLSGPCEPGLSLTGQIHTHQILPAIPVSRHKIKSQGMSKLVSLKIQSVGATVSLGSWAPATASCPLSQQMFIQHLPSSLTLTAALFLVQLP